MLTSSCATVHSVVVKDVSLHRLDARLRDLETNLEAADEPTRQILQRSVELWQGQIEAPDTKDDVNKPLKSFNTQSNPETPAIQ